jgi:hypothetical protein
MSGPDRLLVVVGAVGFTVGAAYWLAVTALVVEWWLR